VLRRAQSEKTELKWCRVKFSSFQFEYKVLFVHYRPGGLQRWTLGWSKLQSRGLRQAIAGARNHQTAVYRTWPIPGSSWADWADWDHLDQAPRELAALSDPTTTCNNYQQKARYVAMIANRTASRLAFFQEKGSHPYFGKTGVRRGSAIVPLDKTLVTSYRLSTVTMPLTEAVWPQFAMQVFVDADSTLVCRSGR